MTDDTQGNAERAVAIVGVGAVMPDAPDAATFWANITGGRYSITDVTPDRWDPALYYDADPHAPEKTYSKIGGWVRDVDWNPLAWKLPIPPLVSAAMDDGQKWAVACTRAALIDAGWPERPINNERTAVILGNAMAGEKHYVTAMRIGFPEFGRALDEAPSFAALPKQVREAVLAEAHDRMMAASPPITEDTMPGELGNVMAGRIANVFDFRGPNFITDAACASALAAVAAGVDGLVAHEFDTVITGGVDRNMGAPSFVKFCKIGALSATGTRPYADGADGFVMGEGAALFLLKRLEDAERDGDRIYAVLRGIAGSSDGRGKGITAPNPVGQRLAVERAWRQAGLDPAVAMLVEGHGTSTRVGDVAEVEALTSVFGPAGAAVGSIALGSVKSNIGHLKAAAGAAGLFKAAFALHHQVLPPSLNFAAPNPNIDFARNPFRVNTELREWAAPAGGVRTAAVSAFGFGGTNFHVVLEEHVPGRLRSGTSKTFAVSAPTAATVTSAAVPAASDTAAKAPLRGLVVVGGADDAAVADRLAGVVAAAGRGEAPAPAAPGAADLAAPVRVALDFADAADLADKGAKALAALRADQPAVWRALRSRGVFLGRGPAPRTAFLFTGQGSQYVNMLTALRRHEPIVAETFAEADRVMTPLLGRPLSDYIFIDGDDPAAVATLEQQLLQTEITQPAVLTTDIALYRLLAAYGLEPDMVMGHSLGEYAALVAAGALSFASALEAVSARGHEMATLSLEDNGAMAAVFAPLAEIQRIVDAADGYVVVANVNSSSQAVVGGATAAVERVVATCIEAGYTAVRIPVSHAFHTSIVAPASVPLMATLQRLDLHAPVRPIVANVDGAFYPTGPEADRQMLDILGRQVASPVQFVGGLETLYDAGARLFVEVGPKRALHGFAEDVLGATHTDAQALFTNHPKLGDLVSFNQALAGIYAAGLGTPAPAVAAPVPAAPVAVAAVAPSIPVASAPHTSAAHISAPLTSATGATMSTDRYLELGHVFADFLEHGREIMERTAPSGPAAQGVPGALMAPVVISGAALGLPGTERVFDDHNVGRLLDGEQFIDLIPTRFRHRILDKHITRLVKGEGGGRFESIDDPADVLKLAGRAGAFDLVEEFGVDPDRDRALDIVTRLAIGAGFDALRDAGIPLVQHYKLTSVGTQLPTRWGLPDAMRDDTGVVFASAFPGCDSFADEITRHQTDLGRRHELESLRAVRGRVTDGDPAAAELDHRIGELETLLAEEGYEFDRRFLFRALSMGHSQFAEIIGARGPNTQVNSACASTTQAISLAEDWIRAGRCRRVVVVAGDDVTSDHLIDWVGAGFLASGAAATDDVVENAALPFDNRRHGMIMGMGAAALVIESADAARERGVQPICEVLATVTANSAFHGTRLDVEHIGSVMERLVSQAESRGVSRHAIAAETVFVSHETYTPARGGSAAAEINALRRVFGPDADQIVIANTKGLTGHPMGVGIEDVLAVKALETGLVPPIPNFREVDPELGQLNLSKGGAYPVRYALRLAAGFGSQISMTLLRWTPVPDGEHREPHALGHGYRIVDPAAWSSWLRRMSGTDDPRLEVVTRRLRVVDTGAPAARPAPVAPVVPVAVPVAVAPVVLPAPAPVAVAPAAPAAPAVPLTAAVSVDPVVAEVLKVVSEKTGYPVEMLDLDLDLEADLGVDTVKQAEVFAAIRETFGIERDDSLQLRDYPTLTHVVGFVRDRATGLPEAPAPAAAPVAVTPAAAAVAPAASASVDPVVAEVLKVVSEKTGYPVEMLDLDLDLEADLGVDTVKQAEVFAAIRGTFGIERDDSLQLRDYPTLTHVVGFVRDRATGLPEQPAPAEGAVAAVPSGEPLPEIPVLTGSIEAADLVARRVPVPVLRPALDRCVPTGARLDESARVLVMADGGGVADALEARLGALGATVLRIDGAPEADALAGRLADFAADGPVTGVYWLPALDAEGPVDELDLGGWHEALRVRVKLMHAAMRAVVGSTPFLVAATRMGGRHGYDPAGAVNPLGGAVTGFAKAYGRETPGVVVKAVDVAPGGDPSELADLLVAETLHDPGCVEVGYADGDRWTIGLEEQPAADGRPGLTLDDSTVYVVTGAAGSIVSAIVADLARAGGGGVFHLLDLAEEPDPTDADLVRYATDREGLKLDLIERHRSGGEKVTPVMVERELAGLERRSAALAAIEAVAAAGGKAYYHSLDLTDVLAVGAAVGEALGHSGRVDVLVHAAGIEISRKLADKEPAEFERVLGVKADGWFGLMSALRGQPLGAVVAFSSVAGRFGNLGQTDYSAANDLLCKLTSSLRSSRPDTRAIAVDWTAWGGIGMATRGSIPVMMAAAGIDMLPPEAGIATIRRELTAGGTRGEIVVAGRLGMMTAEYAEAGGLDVDAIDVSAAGPMIGRVVGMGVHTGLEVETTLDPVQHPFLDHHRIGGTPVLPGVMGMEAFAELARLPFPDRHVAAVEDVDFLRPLKFYRDEPRTIRLAATYVRDGDDIVARCRLEASRQLPGREEPEVTTHFTGRVRLAGRPAPAVTGAAPGSPSEPVVGPAAVYSVYFHGPAYKVLDQVWRHGPDTLGRLAKGLPPGHRPEDGDTVAVPRLVELCFQTAGVAELADRGVLALPAHVGRVVLTEHAAAPKGLLTARVVAGSDGGVDAEVVDGKGRVWVRLEGYRTAELPEAFDEAVLAPLRTLATG